MLIRNHENGFETILFNSAPISNNKIVKIKFALLISCRYFRSVLLKVYLKLSGEVLLSKNFAPKIFVSHSAELVLADGGGGQSDVFKILPEAE